MSQGMGQTVDSKVVEMSFNNQNFEQNAQQSIKTLQSLKQSLNLDGAAKGFSDIDNAAKKVSFEGIAAGIEALEKRFSTFGIVGMTVVQDLTRKVEGMFNGLLSKVTSLPDKAWKLITEGGKARAMGIENSRFMLQGLFPDDLEEVERIMDDAMDSVDGTAYAFDSAAQAASQFAASGLTSGEQMQKALKAITGVAAMTNSEYENISQIFTTVAGNGKLMGDQLLQLSSRGLNAASTLATFFNDVKNGSEKTADVSEEVKKKIEELSKGTETTEADIRDFVSKSKISFDIFSEAMSSSFGEHAKKANETLTGSLANMKAALKKIGAKFYTPLIAQNGPLVEMFNALRIKINEVNKAIDPLVNTLSAGAIKGIETLTNIIKGFDFQHSGFKSFLDALAPKKVSLDDFLGVKNLKGIFVDAGEEAAGLEGKLKQLDDTQKLISRPDQINALESVFIATAKAHGIAIDDMIKKEGSFAATLRKNNWLTTDLYKEALDSVKGIVEGTGNAAIKSEEDFSKIREAALNVIRGDYGNDMDARFAKLAEEGFDPQTVQDYVNALREATGGTWDLSEAAFEAADAAIQAGHSIETMSDEQLASAGYTEEQIQALRALQAEAEKAGMSLSEYLAIEGVTDVKTGAELLLDSLSNLIKGVGKVAGAFKGAWTEIFPPATANTLYKLIQGINNFSKGLIISDKSASKLQNVFKGLFSVVDILGRLFMFIAGPVVGAVINVFRTVGQVILTVASPIGFIITKLDEFLKKIDAFGKISGALNFVFGKIGDGLSFIKNMLLGLPGVTKFIDDFTKAFHDLGIGDGLKGIIEAFKNLGKTVQDYLVSAGINVTKFTKPIATFGATLGGVISRGFTRFKSAFDPKGVYTIGKAVKNTFKDIGAQFKSFGIDISPVTDLAIKTVDAISDFGGKAAKPLKAFASVAGGVASRAFSRFKMALDPNSTYTIGKAFKNTFKDIGVQLKKVGIDVAPISEKISAAFTKVRDVVTNVSKPIRDFGAVASGVVSRGLGRFVDAVGSLDFQVIKTAFVDTFNDAKTSVTNWFKAIDFAGIKDSVKSAFGSARETLSGWFNAARESVVGWFQSIDFNGLREQAIVAFGAAKDTVVNWFGTAKDTLVNWFKSIDFNAVKEQAITVFSNAKDAVINWFTNAKETVAGWLSNIDFGQVKTKIKDAFGTAKDVLVELFSSMGIDAAPVLNTVGKAFNTVFNVVANGGSKAVGHVKRFFKEFKSIPGLTTGISKLKGAFSTTFSGIGEHLVGTWERLKTFAASVKEMGGLKLNNIGDVFRNFKNTVVDYFTNFEGFSAIKEAFVNIGTSIKDAIDGWLNKTEIGRKFLSIKDTIVNVFKSIPSSIAGSWAGIRDFIDRTKETLSKGFTLENIKGVFNDLKSSLGDAFSGLFSEGGLGEKVSGAISGLWDSLKAKIPGLDILDSIKEKFNNFVESVKETFAGVELPDVFGIVTGFFDDLKESIGDLDLTFPESLSDLFGMTVEAAEVGSEAASTVKEGADGEAPSKFDALKVIFGKIIDIAGFVGSHAKELAIGAVALLVLHKVVNTITSITSFIKNKGKAMKSEATAKMFKSLATLVGTIATAMYILSTIEPGALLKAGLALGLMMVVMTAFVVVIEFVNKKFGDGNSLKQMSSLFTRMIILVGVIAAALFVLSTIPIDQLTAAGLALGGIIAVLAGLAAVVGIFKPANTSLLLMAGVIAVIAIVVYALSQLPMDTAIPLMERLSLLIVSLAGAMFVLSLIKGVDVGGIASVAATLGAIIGVIAIIALIVGALDTLTGGFVGGAIEKGMEAFKTILKGIGEAIGALFGSLAGAAIEETCSHLPAIADSIVAFMERMQDANGLTVDWGGVIGALGTVAGAEFVGALGGVASIVTELVTGKTAVEQVGDDLTALAGGLEVWAAAMDKIGPEGIEVDGSGLAELGIAIAAYDGLGLVSGITSIIPELLEGTSAVGLVSQDLINLAEALTTWSDAMDDIGPEGIEVDGSGLADLALAIAGYSGLGLASSITSIIPELLEGTSAVGLVSQDITNLATALGTWQAEMDKIGPGGITVDGSGLVALATAIGGIDVAGVFAAITNKLTEFITGEEGKSPMDLFTENVTKLGEAISTWNEQTAGIKIDPATITAVGELEGAIKELPVGGLIGALGDFLTGSDAEKIGQFQTDVGKLGDALQAFDEAIGSSIDADRLLKLTSAAASIGQLAQALGEIQNYGTFDSILPSFGSNLVIFGGDLKTFTDLEIDIDKLSSLAKSASQLSTMASRVSKIKFASDITDDALFQTFKSNIEDLSTLFSGLATLDTSGVDKLVEGANKINSTNLTDTAKKANLLLKNEAKSSGSEAGSEAGSAYAESIEKSSGDATSAATALSTAASSALSDTSSFRQAGLNMMGAVAGGIYTAASIVTSAAASVASQAADAVSADTSSAGLNFVSGFANGVIMNIYIATAAAARMAQMALDTINAKFRSASPSRETMKIGGWFGQGLAIGIGKETEHVSKVAGLMGDAALKTLDDTIGAVTSIFGQEIDAQPVITPVLDLTEIQNGALAMGNMLAFNDPITVTGNLNAISANMYNRGATNDDLLYALSSLQRTFEANPREANTYIVDGVTYDDGSNITDAVRTLVNATVVQRRS